MRILAVAKSTHGFDGFHRPIYIFAQNRVAQNLNFSRYKNIQATFKDIFIQFNFSIHIVHDQIMCNPFEGRSRDIKPTADGNVEG